MRRSAFRSVWPAALASIVAVAGGALRGGAHDRGVAGRKLLLVDRYASGKAKVVVAASDAGAGVIHHGSGSGDPADLSGTATICPAADPTNAAVYALPAPWRENGARTARYRDPSAAPGGPGVRTLKLSAARSLRLVARNLGDGDAASGDDGPNDLELGDPPGTCTVGVGETVHVELAIADAATATTHRMCSAFTIETAKAVGGGTGCKVVSKTSVAAPCGFCGAAPTTTTTTLPLACGAPGDATCGGTCAPGLVCVFLSFGPGGSGCGCTPPPVCSADGFGSCGGNCPPACLCWSPSPGACECNCV
jgi:hypothetical protein